MNTKLENGFKVAAIWLLLSLWTVFVAWLAADVAARHYRRGLVKDANIIREVMAHR